MGRGITRGHKRPRRAAWPTRLAEAKWEVQRYPGALGGEKRGGLGQDLGGMVFPESRSHPGKGDGRENRKGKDGQTERQTNVRNSLTQQREGSDKEMGHE